MKKTFLKSYKPLRAKKGFSKKQTSLKKTGFKKTLNDEQKKIAEADSKFSKQIILRDGKCLRCGSTSFLSCSHFHKREIFSTRYDPHNCITLCIEDHQEWESKKNTDYKDFMISLLGIEGFNNLEQRSRLVVAPFEAIEAYGDFISAGDDIKF